ncbi:YxD-tail cyclophane-containing RiPP peptide [Streptomyces sp. NPDC059894]|uniref:YxD-tail cyclophane-containing RiPP peptide n=1 Tax=unclassified Streptomyces TaxID=2593676 RepID=UPI003655C5EB
MTELTEERTPARQEPAGGDGQRVDDGQQSVGDGQRVDDGQQSVGDGQRVDDGQPVGGGWADAPLPDHTGHDLAVLRSRVGHPVLGAVLATLLARAGSADGGAVAYHEDSPGGDP